MLNYSLQSFLIAHIDQLLICLNKNFIIEHLWICLDLYMKFLNLYLDLFEFDEDVLNLFDFKRIRQFYY